MQKVFSESSVGVRYNRIAVTVTKLKLVKAYSGYQCVHVHAEERSELF